MMLVSIGVTGNVEEVFGHRPEARDLQEPHQGRPENVPDQHRHGIWAVGDVIGPPWLAHVAHHEAIACIETLCGCTPTTIDYRTSPAAPTPTRRSPASA